MSATTQRDALIVILKAAFGNQNAGVHYYLLETAPGPFFLVGWKNLNNEPETMGNGARKLTWAWALTVFIRDNNNPATVSAQLHSTIDTLNTTLFAHPDLDGTVEFVGSMRASRTPGIARVVGGQAWLPFDAEVETVEWMQ